MKILLCTRRDINGNIALNYFLRHLDLKKHQVSVVLSRHISRREQSIAELVEFEFLECGMLDNYFAMMDCYEPRGNDKQANFSFNQLAQRYNIPITQLGRAKSPEYKQYLRQIQPDLIVSCRYDYIFDSQVIQLPPCGVLNVHPGKLPEYRGLFSPFYALKNNETQLGVTVHWIDEGIDTGAIVAVDYLDSKGSSVSVFDYYTDLYRLGIARVVQLIEALESGCGLPKETQAGGTYYQAPTPADFAQFLAAGYLLVDHASYLNRMREFYHS